MSTRLLPLFSVGLLMLSLFPLLALLMSTDLSAWQKGLQNPQLQAALWLSFWTSSMSMVIIVVLGTPVAWWLSKQRGLVKRLLSIAVELPIVLPPAVVGLALLVALGRSSFLGSLLLSVGIAIPFSSLAVIIAQVMVSCPFYIQGARNAFMGIKPDTLEVARTLGASATETFFRVTIPGARSGLLIALGLAWARALGEFGATLLFAGNLPGTTQTMPVAIFEAFESDLETAMVLALIAVGLGLLLLSVLHLLPHTTQERKL